MHVTWDDSDDTDDEESDDDSHNFITFTISIGSSNSSYESVSDIDDEAYKSNDNEDLQVVYNKLFKVSLTLKNFNAKLTKKIKKLVMDQEET